MSKEELLSVGFIGSHVMSRRRFVASAAAAAAASSGGALFAAERSVASDEKAWSAARGSGEFVFAQWNIGHFAFGKHGDTVIPAAESSARAAEYRGILDGLHCDIVGVCEFSRNFDKGGGQARDLVFGGFRSFEVGPHDGYQCNAIAANAPLWRAKVTGFTRRKKMRYRISCETEVCGVKAVVVETHLDLSEDERRSQIEELVGEFGQLDRVILSGDFNVADGGEYGPLLKAGFAAANFGRFGVFNTHRRRRADLTPAIDNVLVKGFDILGVRTADDALALSDHRILVCRLAPQGCATCAMRQNMV